MGCIEHSTTPDRNGYGVTNVLVGPGKYYTIKAHRYSYELANGPIPAGLSVLHTCDNPRCINPEHLRVGTRADNQKDMAAKGRGRNHNTGKTHCKHGHEFNEANTWYYPDGRGRQCKQCWKDRAQARRS
jgi:hypothetical protein